ncbi:hypothetical protein RPPS3_25930 [Rhodopseudomonas palustris]|uniref:hypothetical protein n=1 Tax=Rhodopseudomonas palustris TaxID=1076 RepID=UPI000D1A21BB|nr:hypothetical protein [Rhodopseudomonas palustris]AVT76656.1 hypothetical protein RPPS3_25930 [Rhodopseudomonas palustris]
MTALQDKLAELQPYVGKNWNTDKESIPMPISDVLMSKLDGTGIPYCWIEPGVSAGPPQTDRIVITVDENADITSIAIG